MYPAGYPILSMLTSDAHMVWNQKLRKSEILLHTGL